MALLSWVLPVQPIWQPNDTDWNRILPVSSDTRPIPSKLIRAMEVTRKKYYKILPTEKVKYCLPISLQSITLLYIIWENVTLDIIVGHNFFKKLGTYNIFSYTYDFAKTCSVIVKCTCFIQQNQYKRET